MNPLLWSQEELTRRTRSEDREVRFWAVDRLIRHYPTDCCDAIADLLLDDHDTTPDLVARHLGEHGAVRHQAILTRAFRLLRGSTPGYCLQALARLGHAGVVELASSSLKRGDLSDAAHGSIVESLADINRPESRDLLRELVARRVELLAEPAAFRGMFRLAETHEIPELLSRFLTALQWRGSHRAGEAIRSLMDELRVDDSAWCFRTGPGGHIELRKTIKAVESGYDCDISSAIGKATINQIAQRFRAGDYGEIIRAIADWTASATTGLSTEPGDEWPRRLAATVEAFARPDLEADIERLGHQVQQWLLGFQLSAAFTVARQTNFDLGLKRARGDLERLLEFAELETAFLIAELPSALEVVCRDAPERAAAAKDWCLRMLDAQGPFFPKVIALESLGSLHASDLVPEIMSFLSDENSYIYGAAEHALSKIGEAIIAPAIARIEAGTLDPDAAHSILVLLCDMGSPAAYTAVTEHLDWFMAEVGPGAAAEWIGLFGTEELIDPLRDWLDDDPVAVGQTLLLLGAINNVQIPEEEEIRRAIEEARATDLLGEEGAAGAEPGEAGDRYVH